MKFNKCRRLAGRSLPLYALSVLLFALSACTGTVPDCPFTGNGDQAPSAGCYLVSESGLLVVQGLSGKVSLPGGSSEYGEFAQCTAVREAWEETGLRLQPRELLRVFDTGFHLYRCESDAQSGEINPPRRFEVRNAFYLPADRFDEYKWRYTDQQKLLQEMLLNGGRVVPE